MQELQQHTGKLKIENYGLWEFLQDFQQGVSQGYELDESNEGFPQVFGSLYTCLLKPKALKQSQEPLFKSLIDLHPGLQEELDAIVIEPEPEPEVEPEVVAKEATFVTEVETDVVPVTVPQVQQQGKRGPKPKN